MARYVFCGGDGKGKTTIAKRLAELFGKPYFKFPYGSDNDTVNDIYTGIEIRKILNDKENKCNAVAFQSLQFVNKLEGIPEILKLEQKYGVVFIDRWWISALIYGIVDGVDIKWSISLNAILDLKMLPTILFIFTGQSFKKDNDIYGEKQAKVDVLYEQFYEDNKSMYFDDVRKGPMMIKIDVTDKTIDEVTLEVLSHIALTLLPGEIEHKSQIILPIKC